MFMQISNTGGSHGNSATDISSARRFSDLALSLAGLVDDSGATLKYLQAKLLEFNWS